MGLVRILEKTSSMLTVSFHKCSNFGPEGELRSHNTKVAGQNYSLTTTDMRLHEPVT